jgi:hypothetical protein
VYILLLKHTCLICQGRCSSGSPSLLNSTRLHCAQFQALLCSSLILECRSQWYPSAAAFRSALSVKTFLLIVPATPTSTTSQCLLPTAIAATHLPMIRRTIAIGVLLLDHVRSPLNVFDSDHPIAFSQTQAWIVSQSAGASVYLV